MPDWTPNWSDVAFDQAAARTAVEACRTAARVTGSSTATAGGARTPAVEDWSGVHRDDFDAEEPVVIAELEDVRADLIALATAIEDGAGRAAAEQRRREGERDRWRRELAEEQASDPAPPGPGGPGGPPYPR